MKKQLTSEERLKVIEAAKKLSKEGGEDAIPVLVSCLSSQLWLVGRFAADGLVRLGALSLPALRTAAEQEDETVRVLVYQTMGRIKSSDSVPFLMEKLVSDPSNDVKLAASVALGCLGDNRGIQHLVSRLGHENFEVRKQSAEGLATIGLPGVPFLLSALKTGNEDMVYWSQAILKLLRLPDPGAIITAFPGDPPAKRRVLADILGNYADESSVECLVAALNDPVWTVRKQASLSLVRIGKSSAGNSEDGQPEVTAIETVLDRLVSCVEGQDPDRQYWGLRTLGEIPVKGAERLSRFLEHEDNDVRRFAVEYLTLTTADPQFIPLLIERLGDASLLVRSAAVNSLLCLGSDIVEPLQQVLKHQNQVVAFHASKVLGQLGDRAEESVLEALRSENDLKRKWAAAVIGEIKASNLAGPLIMALRDESVPVRYTAAASLEQLGVVVLDELIQNIQNENPDISYWTLRVLKKIKHEVIQPLLEILRSGNEDMRFFTAFALGELEDQEAVPGLLQSLHDGSDWVRKLAMESLIKLGALDQLQEVKKDALPLLQKEIELELRKQGIFDVEPLLNGLRSLDSETVKESVRELVAMGPVVKRRLKEAWEVDPDEGVRMWLIKIIRAIDTGSEFGLGF